MPGQQPPITGILESSLYVADLGRARAFYERIFGFRVFFADRRMCAMEVPGAHVLLLFLEGATDEPAPAADGLIPPHHGSGTQHLCFAIPADSVNAWERHLEHERIAIESRLHWPRGGTSLYFRDPDGHSLEVATPGLWPNY